VLGLRQEGGGREYLCLHKYYKCAFYEEGPGPKYNHTVTFLFVLQRKVAKVKTRHPSFACKCWKDERVRGILTFTLA